jgi:hypothetical protein
LTGDRHLYEFEIDACTRAARPVTGDESILSGSNVDGAGGAATLIDHDEIALLFGRYYLCAAVICATDPQPTGSAGSKSG